MIFASQIALICSIPHLDIFLLTYQLFVYSWKRKENVLNTYQYMKSLRSSSANTLSIKQNYDTCLKH